MPTASSATISGSGGQTTPSSTTSKTRLTKHTTSSSPASFLARPHSASMARASRSTVSPASTSPRTRSSGTVIKARSSFINANCPTTSTTPVSPAFRATWSTTPSNRTRHGASASTLSSATRSAKSNPPSLRPTSPMSSSRMPIPASSTPEATVASTTSSTKLAAPRGGPRAPIRTSPNVSSTASSRSFVPILNPSLRIPRLSAIPRRRSRRLPPCVPSSRVSLFLWLASYLSISGGLSLSALLVDVRCEGSRREIDAASRYALDWLFLWPVAPLDFHPLIPSAH
mmetsp:Transcript_3108/g.8025  ORF Transcript_3108/g.8025 Transcript_3108/m.8025 type:complete len:285 (+) Transcript_3108:770-1624(+)